MKRKSLRKELCPIARSLDEIGDWWTLLIVRNAFQGATRFSDFHTQLGLAKNILSARLRTLVGNGILEKRPAADGSARDEYRLTDKGRRLRLVLTALRQWGEDNLFAEGEAMILAQDRLNRPIARLRVTDLDGRPLEQPGEILTSTGRKPKSAHAASPGRRSQAG